MTSSALLKQKGNDNHLCIPYAEVSMTKTSRLTTTAFILTHSFNEAISKRRAGVHTAASQRILRSPELCGEGVLFPGLE